MANITISERAYQNLLTLAHKHGQTPQAVLEALLGVEDDPGKMYDNLDDFFCSLGLNQEAIDRVKSQPDEADPSEYEHASGSWDNRVQIWQAAEASRAHLTRI